MGCTNFDNWVDEDTWTTIAINNTKYNDQNAFNTGNNRFVAPAAGLFRPANRTDQFAT